VLHPLALVEPEFAPLLCSYVANDTLGVKQAKLRLLQQRGWVVLPLRWVEK
jgi:hypothetical protein